MKRMITLAFDAVEVVVASERHKVVDGERRFVAVELNRDRAPICGDLGELCALLSIHIGRALSTSLLVS